MKYYWIRVFDYKKDDELKEHTDENIWESFKGTMLDEYYLCGEELTRDQAKEEVKLRSGVSKFAKPRKNDGIYAIVMDSNQYYYERFTVEVDTQCFNSECLKPVKGKAKDFCSMVHGDKKYHFCSYDCYRTVSNKLNPYTEGEFQVREDYTSNGGVYGYIYHIYNRKTNMHYVGQTIYMPFFRWQEHVKQGIKGDICDLSFETITEVRIKSQEYLNNIEAWWIKKYIEDYGRDYVMNISIPKLTIEDLEREYSRMIAGQLRFA